MYNIVCLKWGTKFQPEYVNRLFYGVRRNTTLPFTFHCFTEDSTGLDSNIVIHPLPYTNIQGWWQKLYLFSDEVNIDGRILFLDLDTLIVGNIDHFISYDTGFVTLRDLWHRKPDDVGSAILSFRTSEHKHIWESFIKDPVTAIRSLHPHGDQKWIQKEQPKRQYWQDIFPNHIVSFKSHCRNGIPNNARIICYHGNPSIIESMETTTKVQGFTIPPTSWVKKFWRDD